MIKNSRLRGTCKKIKVSGRVKIVTSALIWGSVGIFARFSRLDGLSLTFLRVSLGSLAFLMIFSFQDKTWIKTVFQKIRLKFWWILLLGVALALNWVFLFTALLYTQIAKVILIYYMAPIFATLMSIKFLNERITTFRAFLIGLAFFGAFLMVSEAKFELGDRDFVGMSFAFLGAIFYAMIPTLGRFLKNIESEVLTFAQLAVASVVLLPLVGMGKASFSNAIWWAVVILVLVHTVFALLNYMSGLKDVEVNEAALLSYLDPLSAIIYAFLVFGEIPSFRTLIGGGLILLASVLDIIKGEE
jgi:drug/metabolite transporter (DMT)-like permease